MNPHTDPGPSQDKYAAVVAAWAARLALAALTVQAWPAAGQVNEPEVFAPEARYTVPTAQGTRTISIGHRMESSKTGMLNVCSGSGTPAPPPNTGAWLFERCVGHIYNGDSGQWTISPDGRWVLVQDIAAYGHPRLQLLDTLELRPVSLPLSMPRPRGRDDGLGPDPTRAQATFSADSHWLALTLGGRDAWIYAVDEAGAWAFSRHVQSEQALAGVYTIDGDRLLTWSLAGRLELWDGTASPVMRVELPGYARAAAADSQVVIVSRNRQYVLLLTQERAWRVDLSSALAHRLPIPSGTASLASACSASGDGARTQALPTAHGRYGRCLLDDSGRVTLVDRRGRPIVVP